MLMYGQITARQNTDVVREIIHTFQRHYLLELVDTFTVTKHCYKHRISQNITI